MRHIALTRADWVARARSSRGLRVMRGLPGFAAALGLAALMASGARAQGADTDPAEAGRAVLLELYTAQGCAACPPADDMILDLAGRDDVIALALHVDYWDYIGWADTFANRAYTERQQQYARRLGHSTIYTPQVVINGTGVFEGFRVMQVMEAIADQHARIPEVSIALARTDTGGLQIHIAPVGAVAPQVAMASRRLAVAGISANAVVGTLSMESQSAPVAAAPMPQDPLADAAVAADAVPMAVIPVPERGPYTVQLVRYRDHDSVDILDGENAGRQAAYANIVTSWQIVANWDMLMPLDLTVPLDGDEPAVVLVQEAGQGEVIAAARLR